MTGTSRRARVFKAVQYGLGVLALVWVFTRVDWTQVSALAGRLSVGTVLALVAVSGVELVVGFYLWYVLLDAVQRTRFLAAANTGLIVLFVNNLLPSRLSGRAVAPFVINNRTGMDYPEAVAVSGVHTGLYALVYGLLSVAGLLAAFDQLSAGFVVVLALSAALYVAAGALVLLAGVHMSTIDMLAAGLDAVARRLPVVGDQLALVAEKLPGFTAAAATTFRSLVRNPTAMASYVAGVVVVLLIAPGLRVWLLFGALGVEYEPMILLPLYLVTAYSVTLLPLTPGGVGVSEASATAVFIALGIPSHVVVPTIFLDRLFRAYLPALLGWYPSLRTDFSGLVSE